MSEKISSPTPADSAAPAVGKRQFPCRQCGAKLEFLPGTATLQCPYCGAQVSIPQAEHEVKELDFAAYLQTVGDEQAEHEVLVIKCAGCGAETTTVPDTTAGRCSFCAQPFVATAQSQRLIKPGSVLPFALDRKQAFDQLRDWMGSLWLAPNDLQRSARTEQTLRGVYVPYWTYDADATTWYTGQRGDDYWESENYTTTENGKLVTRTRQVRRTRWSYASGMVYDRFDDVLVLASRSLPSQYAEALEPWDLKDLTPYKDEYLSGFEAQSYQVTLVEGFEEAKSIMEVTIRRTVARDIGGDHQHISSLKTQHDRVRFKHLLLPIWISAYQYRGKTYRFLVNARTGEVQGERPWSAVKVTILVLVILALLLTLATMYSSQGGGSSTSWNLDSPVRMPFGR